MSIDNKYASIIENNSLEKTKFLVLLAYKILC
jgi:hypothetical protein